MKKQTKDKLTLSTLTDVLASDSYAVTLPLSSRLDLSLVRRSASTIPSAYLGAYSLPLSSETPFTFSLQETYQLLQQARQGDLEVVIGTEAENADYLRRRSEASTNASPRSEIILSFENDVVLSPQKRAEIHSQALAAVAASYDTMLVDRCNFLYRSVSRINRVKEQINDSLVDAMGESKEWTSTFNNIAERIEPAANEKPSWRSRLAVRLGKSSIFNDVETYAQSLVAWRALEAAATQMRDAITSDIKFLNQRDLGFVDYLAEQSRYLPMMSDSMADLTNVYQLIAARAGLVSERMEKLFTRATTLYSQFLPNLAIPNVDAISQQVNALVTGKQVVNLKL